MVVSKVDSALVKDRPVNRQTLTVGGRIAQSGGDNPVGGCSELSMWV